MKALAIKQPWAYLIVNGFKDIENRTWRTALRGRFYVHASKAFDNDGYQWVMNTFNLSLPHPNEFKRGGLVGVVDLVDCVDRIPKSLSHTLH